VKAVLAGKQSKQSDRKKSNIIWKQAEDPEREVDVETLLAGAEIPAHKLHGMLSLEHSGRPANSNDGCCLTLLISVKVPLESVCLIDKYSWLETERTLGDQLIARLGKNMTVPLAVIR